MHSIIYWEELSQTLEVAANWHGHSSFAIKVCSMGRIYADLFVTSCTTNTSADDIHLRCLLF